MALEVPERAGRGHFNRYGFKSLARHSTRHSSALFPGVVVSISGDYTTESWQNGYCTSLENWRPQGLTGSNPVLSAKTG